MLFSFSNIVLLHVRWQEVFALKMSDVRIQYQNLCKSLKAVYTLKICFPRKIVSFAPSSVMDESASFLFFFLTHP